MQKHTDTLNLLWAGCLHDAAIYNSFGEITGYTVSKARLGAEVTFRNLREVNGKIITAILRDLLPQDEKTQKHRWSRKQFRRSLSSWHSASKWMGLAALYYTGTVTLQMNPQQFWRTTPVQLSVLSSVHGELLNPKKQKTAMTVEEAGMLI